MLDTPNASSPVADDGTVNRAAGPIEQPVSGSHRLDFGGLVVPLVAYSPL